MSRTTEKLQALADDLREAGHSVPPTPTEQARAAQVASVSKAADQASDLLKNLEKLTDEMLKASRLARRRFKLIRSGVDQFGNWALNFGASVAKNAGSNAVWRYEVYLSFWTLTLRIGFGLVAKPIVDKVRGTKVTLTQQDDGSMAVERATDGSAFEVSSGEFTDEASQRP